MLVLSFSVAIVCCIGVTLAILFIAVFVFLLFLLVEASQIILAHHVLIVGGLSALFTLVAASERFYLFATFVAFDDSFDFIHGEGHKVDSHIRGCAVLHCTGKDITLEVIVSAVKSLKLDISRRKLFLSLQVCVHLKVHAAFQFGALACKFLWVRGDVLVACG